jgi:hypothetical protein
MATNGKPRKARNAKVQRAPDISTNTISSLDQINVNPNYLVPKDPFVGRQAINSAFSFTALWNFVSRTYWSRSDEALRENFQNALAARRDAFIYELLRSRQLPVAELSDSIDVDDPEDPQQTEVAETLSHLIKRIPNFQQMKLNLLEALWFGKNGVQLTWDYINYGGNKYLSVVDFADVQGDKIIWRYEDDVPGILVNRNFSPPGAAIVMTDRGSALLLTTPYWRDRFIIHAHEKSDSDYQFESQLAGRIKGVGLRDRCWFVYQLRLEILSWLTDALQRLGTNGMLIGYYDSGNTKAMNAMIEGLKILSRDNVVAMPNDVESKDIQRIDHIEPAGVAYDVLFKAVQYCDEILRRLVLGQNLSTESAATGLGSGVADFQKGTLQNILRFDAANLSQTLTDQLLGPLIRYNFGELDFHPVFRLEIEVRDMTARLETAKLLHDMGVDLSHKDLRELGGFREPDPEEIAELQARRMDELKQTTEIEQKSDKPPAKKKPKSDG